MGSIEFMTIEAKVSPFYFATPKPGVPPSRNISNTRYKCRITLNSGSVPFLSLHILSNEDHKYSLEVVIKICP